MKGKDETAGLRALLIRVGVALVVFALAIVLYRLGTHLHSVEGITILGIIIHPFVVVSAFVLISLVIGLSSDINHVSMHRYYRDRLLEAYMPEFKNGRASFTTADRFYIRDIHIDKTGAPYHIINAMITTSGSENSKLKSRGGDNFIFSPIVVGSKATGYRKTKEYIGGEISLATALSISGAAVDPNTGATRSRPLSFLMTLLNVRLGYWLLNPACVPTSKLGMLKSPAPVFWHSFAFREMMGVGLNEHQTHIHLTDGGHFENLGLYELVRRHCPYIIVSDASADPTWTFKDLARACELVRADFCAETDIDTRPIHPSGDTGYSKSAFVRGTITYPSGASSKVIYVTTALTSEGLPEDIHGYKRVDKAFPDDSTANQFYDEAQFEAYRELGYRIGESVFESWAGKPEAIFEVA